jgi:hypothetical protein
MCLPLLQVCKCSNEICLQLYEKEPPTDKSYLHIHGFVFLLVNQCFCIRTYSSIVIQIFYLFQAEREWIERKAACSSRCKYFSFSLFGVFAVLHDTGILTLDKLSALQYIHMTFCWNAHVILSGPKFGPCGCLIILYFAVYNSRCQYVTPYWKFYYLNFI